MSAKIASNKVKTSSRVPFWTMNNLATDTTTPSRTKKIIIYLAFASESSQRVVETLTPKNSSTSQFNHTDIVPTMNEKIGITLDKIVNFIYLIKDKNLDLS